MIYSFEMMGKAADLGISLLDKKFGGDKKPLYKRVYAYAIMVVPKPKRDAQRGKQYNQGLR